MNDINSEQQLEHLLRAACAQQMGAVSHSFLCQSVGILDPREPLCVSDDTPLTEVLSMLRTNKIGCVLVTDGSDKLCGIFSERDWILKVAGGSVDSSKSIKEAMTAEPVTQAMDSSIAYALNLMSKGGFRHLPIVDENNIPIGIISVKDVVDHIAKECMQTLLGFDVEEEIS